MPVDLRITTGRIRQFRDLAAGATRGTGTPPINRREHARQRAEFEQRLGAGLFIDRPTGPDLSAAGAASLEWAEDLLRRADALAEELRGLASGSRGRVEMVTSLALASYRLPPILARFSQRHPDIHVRMNVAHTDQAIDLVGAARQDFAIVTIGVEGISRPLRAIELGREPVVLVASPDRDDPPATVTPNDLKHLPFVDNDRGLSRRSRELRALGVTQRRVVATLGHPEPVKDAVRAGLGVALLPRITVADELAAGALREVEVQGAAFAIPVCVIQRADAHELTPAQQRFLRFLTEEFSPAGHRPASPGHQPAGTAVP